MTTNTLLEKVLGAVAGSQQITERYKNGYGNFCGTTLYSLNNRVAVEYLHNGCEIIKVYIDGTEVDMVPRDTVMSAIRQRQEQIKLSLIASI